MLYSKPCEYGIRVMVSLANSTETNAIAAHEISKRENIPLPMMGKILQDLRRKKLIESQRGPGGGFFLARPPDTILLRDVVEAIDGLDRFKQCVLGMPQCNEKSPCLLHSSWKEAKTHITNYMDTTTLAQMAQAAEGLKNASLGKDQRTDRAKLQDSRQGVRENSSGWVSASDD